MDIGVLQHFYAKPKRPSLNTELQQKIYKCLMEEKRNAVELKRKIFLPAHGIISCCQIAIYPTSFWSQYIAFSAK